MAGLFFTSQSKLLIPVPLQISDCQLWLNAGLGVTYDGSDLISAWADQSGNGNHATASGTSRPKFIASSALFNNEPTVEFDGINDFLTGTIIPNLNTSDFTIFIVNRAKIPTSILSAFFEINTYSNGWLFGIRPGGFGYNIYNNNDNVYIYEYTDSGDLYSKILSTQKDYSTKTDILVNSQIIASSTSAVLNGTFTNM